MLLPKSESVSEIDIEIENSAANAESLTYLELKRVVNRMKQKFFAIIRSASRPSRTFCSLREKAQFELEHLERTSLPPDVTRFL